MGALEMGLPESELSGLIQQWRTANPRIVQFWWDVDRAVKTCIAEKTQTETHGIQFQYQSGFLFITLPSGRRLAYVKPRIGENRFGGESVTYEGVGSTKKWERIESYGPKLVENIVQATARDILADAMRRLDAAGYCIVMHVHDEVVIEALKTASLEEIFAIMGITPMWAKRLQLRADGFVCDYYMKA
jgi:DNA polymerase